MLGGNSEEDIMALINPTSFPVSPPTEHLKIVDQFCCPNNPDIKFNHGTTTLGFIFNGGVLIAVDSRASMGSYIGSGTVKKVIPISKFLLGDG